MWWTSFFAFAVAAEPPLDAVVVVQQGASVCAGAFVDDEGTVVTAYHCVAAGGPVRVERRDGTRFYARVTAARAAEDLALLDTDAASAVWLELRGSAIEQGMAVWAVGHPLGAQPPGGFLEGTLRYSVARGVVSAVGTRAVQVDAPLNSGNSGGPILDDEGRLVAVVSRRLAGDGLGFAARVDAVRAMIEEGGGYRPLGGTVALGLHGATWGGPAGTIGVGGRLEVALRDRVFSAVAVTVPWQGRWDAVALGATSWVGEEVHVGLRQRAFTGPLTLRIDAYGGAASVRRIDGQPDLSLRRTSAPGWLAGGALTWPALGVGVDAAWVEADDAAGLRMMLRVTRPGTIWMF